MLQIAPFLAWAAAIVSAAVLVVVWWLGEMSLRARLILTGCFAVAAYLQFFAGSVPLGAIGLALQTILAVGLVARFKLDR